MKLKYHFETVETGEDIIAVPVGEGAKKVNGVIVLNGTGKEMLDLLENDTSEEHIVSVLSGKYDDPRDVITGYVRKTISTLREAGIIEN